MERAPYPSDVSDAEWAFVAPYLTLMRSDAPQHVYELRDVFNGVRWLVHAGAPWRLLPNDLPSWHIYPRSWLASAGFQARVRCCAAAVGVRRAPKVRVTVDLGPWALVTGLLRPQVVLSTGLLALLDAEELDAVLCHELIHLRQGDMLRTIVAGALHDLSWFIPPARRLYALLRMEQELACDDALHEESRRLALASARARVWQAGLSGPPVPRNALTLLPTGPRSSLEWRVRRLEPRIIEEAVPSSGTG